MVRRRWRSADVPEGLGPDHPWAAVVSPVSQQSYQLAVRSQPRQQPKPSPPVVKTSGTRFTVGHGSPGTGGQVGVSSGSSALCGGSRSRQSSSRLEAGQGGEVIAVGRAGQRV